MENQMKRNKKPDIVEAIELLEAGYYSYQVVKKLNTTQTYLNKALRECPKEIQNRYEVAMKKNLKTFRLSIFKQKG